METRRLADLPSSRGNQVASVRTSHRFRLWVIVVWVVILGLLFLALRQIPLAQIWDLLSQVKAEQIVGLMAVNVGIIFLMALRWRMILKAMGSTVSLRTLVAYRLAGFGVSYFTPGPQFGGEPLQVHLLHDKQFVPLATAVSSVFLDRLVDQLANFTFLVLGAFTILLSGVTGSGPENGAWIPIVGLFLFPLCHLLALGIGKLPVSSLLKILERRLRGPRILRLVQLICQAEDQISGFMRHKPWTFFWVIGLAGFTWLVILFEFWLSLRILGVLSQPDAKCFFLDGCSPGILTPAACWAGRAGGQPVSCDPPSGLGPCCWNCPQPAHPRSRCFTGRPWAMAGGYAYRSTLFGRLPSDERSE